MEQLSNKCIIDPSLILDMSSLTTLTQFIERLSEESVQFLISGRFKQFVSGERYNDYNIHDHYEALEVSEEGPGDATFVPETNIYTSNLVQLKNATHPEEIREFVSDLKPYEAAIDNKVENLDSSINEVLESLRIETEGIFGEILVEQAVFLFSESNILSRIRRPLHLIRDAGARAVDFGKSKLDGLGSRCAGINKEDWKRMDRNTKFSALNRTSRRRKGLCLLALLKTAWSGPRNLYIGIGDFFNYSQEFLKYYSSNNIARLLSQVIEDLDSKHEQLGIAASEVDLAEELAAAIDLPEEIAPLVTFALGGAVFGILDP
jgi:hypothetical protein